MHQLAARQDRIRSHDFLPIDSAEGGGEQAKILDKHDIVIDHDQVPNVKHMCGENKDELGG
jgi:hypothetical protein